MWPAEGTRVVRIRPSHKGDPKLYVAVHGVVVQDSGSFYTVQLADGSHATVAADRCIPSSPAAARIAINSRRETAPRPTHRTRTEAIDPRDGVELSLFDQPNIHD